MGPKTTIPDSTSSGPLEGEVTDEPGFLQPPSLTPDDPALVEVTEPTTMESPATEPTTTQIGPWRDDEGYASDWHDGPGTPSSTRVEPSRVSTADPESFAGLIAIGLGMAGLALHTRLAPGDNAVWLVDEQDHAAIASPLSRIIARRVKVTGGKASDVTDGIDVLVGTAGYAVKNLQAQAMLRAAGAAGPEVWQQQQHQDPSAWTPPTE